MMSGDMTSTVNIISQTYIRYIDSKTKVFIQYSHVVYINPFSFDIIVSLTANHILPGVNKGCF